MLSQVLLYSLEERCDLGCFKTATFLNQEINTAKISNSKPEWKGSISGTLSYKNRCFPKFSSLVTFLSLAGKPENKSPQTFCRITKSPSIQRNGFLSSCKVTNLRQLYQPRDARTPGLKSQSRNKEKGHFGGEENAILQMESMCGPVHTGRS